MSERTIMHLDMDAYFASVEQQCNPALRGKPIAVIGSGARTIVTTSSYEAREWGVKTGMTVYEARRRCPHIILVEGNNTKYTDTCAELVSVYRCFTPLVEVYSVDEAFLDLTGSLQLFGGARVYRAAHQGARAKTLRPHLLSRDSAQQAPGKACQRPAQA